MVLETQPAPSDVELLRDYLTGRLEQSSDELSLESALSGFEDYYRRLCEMREKIAQAKASLERGEGRELDVEAMIARIRKRLAERGITD